MFWNISARLNSWRVTTTGDPRNLWNRKRTLRLNLWLNINMKHLTTLQCKQPNFTKTDNFWATAKTICFVTTSNTFIHYITSSSLSLVFWLSLYVGTQEFLTLLSSTVCNQHINKQLPKSTDLNFPLRHSVVVVVYINTMKTTSLFNFDFYHAWTHNLDRHNHGNKEKLSINSHYLKLKLVRNQNRSKRCF